MSSTIVLRYSTKILRYINILRCSKMPGIDKRKTKASAKGISKRIAIRIDKRISKMVTKMVTKRITYRRANRRAKGGANGRTNRIAKTRAEGIAITKWETRTELSLSFA